MLDLDLLPEQVPSIVEFTSNNLLIQLISVTLFKVYEPLRQINYPKTFSSHVKVV